MSILSLFLGWTKLPQWAIELIAVAAVAVGAVGAFWWYHHHVYVQGMQAAIAQEEKRSAAALAAAHAHDAAVLNAQLAAYKTLETKYAATQASDLAIAGAFTDGVRHAYASGRASALSEVTPSATVVHAPAASGSSHAAILQAVGDVFSACAEDDAELTSLQVWITTQLSLFNPEKSYGSAK